jgi:superfamily II DNA or RNA helicase
VVTKSLRPYQVGAKNAVFETVESSVDRALIVMATGLGKTFTAAEIYEEWFARFGGKALFVVHQVEIAEQAMAEFQAHLPKNIICGLLTSDRAENVSKCHILFTTFQSMHERTRRLFEKDHFNLIIVDEAHHSHADTYRPVIEYFNSAFRLALTATPNRADGQNIRTLFGDEVFSYTLAQGIVDGYLANMDYRVENDNIDLVKLQELVDRATGGDRRVSLDDIDSTIFLHERLEAIVAKVREVEAEFGRKLKKIFFCQNLTHIHEVCKHLAGSEPYHSKLSRDRRVAVLADFKAGNVQEILTRDMFNEGIDVPDAEMLVFLRGTDSETIWTQQLGRGLRRSNGKTHVVILDFVANCDRIMAVDELRNQISSSSGSDQNKDRDHKSKLLIKGTGWSFTFAEEIRNVLDLLQRWDTPQADKDGTFVKDGEVWVTTYQLTRILKLSSNAISSRVPECRHEEGRDSMGRIQIFYALSDAKRECADLLENVPRANANGTFEAEGETWGAVQPLARILGVSNNAINDRRSLCRQKPGKTLRGNLQTFYSLVDAKRACADLLKNVPRANQNGTFEAEGEIWGTTASLSELLDIPRRKIQLIGSTCRQQPGKDTVGRTWTFYSASDVKKACEDVGKKKT